MTNILRREKITQPARSVYPFDFWSFSCLLLAGPGVVFMYLGLFFKTNQECARLAPLDGLAPDLVIEFFPPRATCVHQATGQVEVIRDFTLWGIAVLFLTALGIFFLTRHRRSPQGRRSTSSDSQH